MRIMKCITYSNRTEYYETPAIELLDCTSSMLLCGSADGVAEDYDFEDLSGQLW